MSSSLNEQADKSFRQTLFDSWEPANTNGYGPDPSHADTTDVLPIHYGNYDSNLSDPQISIRQPQGEVTVGGRWSGMDGTSQAMNQYRRGLLVVQVWADGGGTYNDDLAAQRVVIPLREEVERVSGTAVDGPPSGPNQDLIWSFSAEWNGRRRADGGADVTDPTWQSQLTVTYDWERQTS